MSEPSKPRPPKATRTKAPEPPDQEADGDGVEPPPEGSPNGGDKATSPTTPRAGNGDTGRHVHEWKRITDLDGRTNAATFHTHRCRCGASVRRG